MSPAHPSNDETQPTKNRETVFGRLCFIVKRCQFFKRKVKVMPKLFWSCFALVALLTTAAHGQSPRTCSVGAVWWHSETGMGSGHMLLGEFVPSVGREPIIKHFKYYDTGLIVSVGVRYVYPENSSKPDFMELALVVSDKEEGNVFHTSNNAVAELLYKNGWRHFSVSLNVTHDERLNTFKLRCWESRPNKR